MSRHQILVRDVKVQTKSLSQSEDAKASVGCLSQARNRVMLTRTCGGKIFNIAKLLVLDIPLIVFFLSYTGIAWMHRLHDLYISLQVQAMAWTDERAAEEITYYERFCTIEDMSTQNPNDLFLSHNASVDVAYHHQLKHGFSVFPSVLSKEVALELRAHINAKNQILPPEESIYVIENEHRYSFGLDLSESSVKKALKEVSNHAPLSRTLEKVLGPDPAMIELTSITSSYGSADQWW